MTKNSGMIVETKTGITGRTINSKGLINGKVPVYAATEFRKFEGIDVPIAFSDRAMLCNPTTLTIKGFID
jgi:hypothetical protein